MCNCQDSSVEKTQVQHPCNPCIWAGYSHAEPGKVGCVLKKSSAVPCDKFSTK